MSTFAGKIKILQDVKEKKYQLPPNFPTLAELQNKNGNLQSSLYLKTSERHKTIEVKREKRIQEKFIDDATKQTSSFRKTTRDYHEDKEHNKLLHGALVGRYSPNYERVWSKAPVIQIAGVKDRFGYGNKNSPNFVKRAEG